MNAFFGCVGLVLLAAIGLHVYAQRELLQHFKDPDVALRFRSIHLSKTHYIYVCYEVTGDKAISSAFWRLRDNSVEVEK